MELAKLENPLPLKAYPEKTLDTILTTAFKFWISNLFSMKADQNDKVDLALPSIKKHCWSMGLNDVKKMFEMYIDGELDLKPVPNHLDRILVGQIYNSYKQQKRANEVKTVNEKEIKDNQDFLYCVQAFDFYNQNNELPEVSVWLYDYITSYKKLISYSEKERKQAYNIELENNLTEDEAKTKAKLKLVYRYFDKLITKGTHVKEYL